MSKCGVCAKSVYHMDSKLNLDGQLYHTACAKCAECGCQITINNGNKTDDAVYCNIHFATKFLKDGGYISPERLASGSRRDSAASNIETKSLKCGSCGENVYHMDSQVKFDSVPYHTTCAKCSECGCQISLSNYTKAGSVLFCQVHFDKKYKNERGFGNTSAAKTDAPKAAVEVAKNLQCGTCGKAVYPMEPQVRLDGVPYHQPCAKCCECATQITLSNFCKDGATLYCKTHYLRKFQQDGGYAGDDKFKKRGSVTKAPHSAQQGAQQGAEQGAEATEADEEVSVSQQRGEAQHSSGLEAEEFCVDESSYEHDEARPSEPLVADCAMLLHHTETDGLGEPDGLAESEAAAEKGAGEDEAPTPSLLNSFSFQPDESDPNGGTKAKKIFMM